MEIILWTIGCGQCKVLQKKLDGGGFKYQVKDDINEMNELGIKSLPRLCVDGKDMGFGEAVRWVNEHTEMGGAYEYYSATK